MRGPDAAVEAAGGQEPHESVRSLVREYAGLAFSPSRIPPADAAIDAHRRSLGVDWPAYERILRSDADNLQTLLERLTIGESYFFRDRPQVELLANRIVPEVVRRVPTGTIRLWSAGCAAGEEPYSLAMLACELGVGERTRVLGTDLSRARLDLGRRARYTRWALRGVDQHLVGRYFRRCDTQFEVTEPVRAMVELRRLNLAALGTPGVRPQWPMQVIVCRNVLIYLDAETVARVIRGLFAALDDGGWLLLGASDPIASDLVPCEVVVTEAGLAYRRRDARSTPSAPATRTPVVVAELPATPEHPPAIGGAFHAVRHSASEVEGPRRASPEPAQRKQPAAAGEPEPGEWIARVRALADLGAIEEAMRSCERATERHPLCAELAQLRALLLASSGHDAAAIAEARRALYLDRTLVVAHVTLGDGLARQGDRVAARRAYLSAARLLEDLPDGAPVPASNGAPAARLTSAVAARLALMGGGE